jgi:streptomycin 6-kinase
VHPGLEWLRELPEGRAWLERLPRLVEECRQQWSLQLEPPFPYSYTSLAVPAGAVVLKIQFPDRESEHEADALALWDGEGAVRLVARDDDRHAFLIERCRPGTSLAAAGQEEAVSVFAGLLPRLWRPAGAPFRPLEEEAAWWADRLRRRWESAGRPFEEELVAAARDALAELAPTQEEHVLVHQDLHADNVLRAEREPWLAIDPKPLVGERAFGLAPIVRSFELGGEHRDLLYRLDRLSTELGVDRDRARRWTLAQTVAWSLGSDYLPQHVQAARWLLQAE